jgi:prepilin-type N-terminal cleavage/methylation domain-containing protein/prepilin-type processing-associated H-X9-DG protein
MFLLVFRIGFTLIEVLVSMGIIGLLVGILAPALAGARAGRNATGCASNLHSIGQLIHAFANSHDDNVAAVVREHDYFWNRGQQLGWDIQTGRWAASSGGPQSLWQCRQTHRPFVGNARSLGLDNRQTIPGGLLHNVGPRMWYEPSRLVLAYDAGRDQPIAPLGRTGGFSTIDEYTQLGDVSDEDNGLWPRNEPREYVGFFAARTGPHPGGRTGVLFADGHARIGLFLDASEAVLWSGLRWWADEVAYPP